MKFGSIAILAIIICIFTIALWPWETEELISVSIFTISLTGLFVWLSLRLGFGIKINKIMAEGAYIFILSPLYILLRRLIRAAQKAYGKVRVPAPKRKKWNETGTIFDVLNLKLKPMEVVLGAHWGRPIRIKLDKAHTIIGGSTFQGKTVILNGIIAQLLLNYRHPVDIWLFDLKGAWEDGMRLWKPVIARYIRTEEEAVEALTDLWALMMERMDQKNERDVVIIMDELVQLTSNMSPEYRREATQQVVRLTRMCRSAGMWVVGATQYPRFDDLPKAAANNLLRKVCLGVAGSRQAGVILEMTEAIPVPLPDEKGEFILREGKDFRVGRSIMVHREDIERIVLKTLMNSYQDERMNILLRVITGLKPGDSIPGLNGIAESIGVSRLDLKHAYRNFYMAGAFELGGDNPQAGYRLACETTEALGKTMEFLKDGKWEQAPPSPWGGDMPTIRRLQHLRPAPGET